MTGARIDVRLDDAAARAALERLAALGRSPREALKDIGATLKTSTQRRFELQQGPDGRPWPPLSRRTLKRRGAGAKMLRDSGGLYNTVNFQLESDTIVAVGVNKKYAAIHQFGGTVTLRPVSRLLKVRDAKVVLDKQKRIRRVLRRGQALGEGETVATRRLFASREDKKAKERWFTFGERKIRIPARPYLGLSAQDRRDAIEILREHAAAAAAGGAP